VTLAILFAGVPIGSGQVLGAYSARRTELGHFNDKNVSRTPLIGSSRCRQIEAKALSHKINAVEPCAIGFSRDGLLVYRLQASSDY